MTTHRHAVDVLGRPHERRKILGAVFGVAAAVFCAVMMVGNVTWAEETNWFMFAFAGFGVVGFGTMALEQWQEWPKGGEPAWTHGFGAIFWFAFGAYQAFAVVYQLFVTDATNWWLVAIVPVLAVAMFAIAYQEGRKALAG